MSHGKKDAEIDVRSIVSTAVLQELPVQVTSLDHTDHVTRIALAGHPQLAADHLLNPEIRERLANITGSVIRQLNLEFVKSRLLAEDTADEWKNKIRRRQWSYETLIEIALNLVGLESDLCRFPKQEVRRTLSHIIQTLTNWATLEKREQAGKNPLSEAVVDKILTEMRKVMAGKSMLAKMAEEIEEQMEDKTAAARFVSAATKTIQQNVYYRMSASGMCKFGNDYAVGLRWLRHLGYVQVSTNPVLAASAYQDLPELWNSFEKELKQHPEWFENPSGMADNIAMEATMVALWPNLTVFRPIALLSGMHHGMVSYQLNPNVAASLDGSLKDGLKIYSAAQEFLTQYDALLAWGYNKEERGRPNIVFKVAGSSPAAVDITTAFNRLGIGTNNTVTYTVSQETTLILAAMKGMAEALKSGISITQAYETNMGGRLESHLREVEAERILKGTIEHVEDKEGLLSELAEGLGATAEIHSAASLDEKIRVICSYKYLKSLSHPAFISAITQGKRDKKPKEKTSTYLSRLEGDIGLAGTFVAQRVYEIFFSPRSRPKWLLHLRNMFGLSATQAAEIMDKIDLLPASKRKPNDTYFTLARRNMTNTEFPNHQLAVLQASRDPGFRLKAFENAVLRSQDSGVLNRLLRLNDFRRAYELTPELPGILRKVGIHGNFGRQGLAPKEWATFGSVVKTMKEFTDAYNEFKKRCVYFVLEAARAPSTS